MDNQTSSQAQTIMKEEKEANIKKTTDLGYHYHFFFGVPISRDRITYNEKYVNITNETLFKSSEFTIRKEEIGSIQEDSISALANSSWVCILIIFSSLISIVFGWIISIASFVFLIASFVAINQTSILIFPSILCFVASIIYNLVIVFVVIVASSSLFGRQRTITVVGNNLKEAQAVVGHSFLLSKYNSFVDKIISSLKLDLMWKSNRLEKKEKETRVNDKPYIAEILMNPLENIYNDEIENKFEIPEVEKPMESRSIKTEEISIDFTPELY